MLDWLKNINKDYPEFWKEYLLKFDSKSQRVVILDLLLSGTNISKDVILSIGAIGIEADKIIISDTFETVIVQYKYLHDNQLPIDSIAKSSLPKNTEAQALENLVKFIENSVVVGFHTQIDVDMINVALDKLLCGRIKNEVLDIQLMHQKLHDDSEKMTLSELFELYKLPSSDEQSALENAYNLAIIYLKLKTKLGIKI